MDWKQFFSRLRGVLIWFGKVVLVVVAIAAAMALLAWIAEFQQSSNANFPESAAVAWLILIGLCVVIVVLFFVTRLACRLFVSPPGTWNLFGDTVASRLIGLGAVTLIYPRAIVSLIKVPISVLVQMFADMPQVISRMSQAEGQASFSLDQVFSRLIPLLQNTASEVGKALYRLLDQVPVYEVILALALWTIVGRLLSTPEGATPAGAPQLSQVRLITYLRNLSEQQRRNLWLGLVFFAGIYLSIAAIVAIPWLQEDKAPQSLTREKLEKALQTLVPKTDDTYVAAVTAQTPQPLDPLAQLEETLNQTIKRLDETKDVKLSWNQTRIIEDARQTISFVKTGRTELQERQKQLRNDIRQRQSQIVNEALNAFDSEMLSPMSTQERALFFRDIQRSTQYQVAEMQRALSDCARTVSDAEKLFDFVARDLSPGLSRLDQTPSTPLGPRLGASSMLSSMSTLSARGCNSMSLGPLQYTSPDPGATWGPFALVAQWLLRTKSQALALITGMLGFGLLGAAIATFVRPTDKAGTSSPAGDAATIIIRGLSAAIVIFLAVKGGLAIVSSGEAEPNAYVLFFTCLVGAVFSEGVWQWAKIKIEGYLPNDNDSAKAPQDGKPSNEASAVSSPGVVVKPALPPASPPAPDSHIG
jgi:hypothetical protein